MWAWIHRFLFRCEFKRYIHFGQIKHKSSVFLSGTNKHKVICMFSHSLDPGGHIVSDLCSQSPHLCVQ